MDPAEPEPVIAAMERAGGRLDLILLTHHHADHVAGTDAVRERFGAKVVGAAADAHRLPKLDHALKEGDEVQSGRRAAQVIDTPGHTRGQINFYFPAGGVLLGRHAVQPGLRAADRRHAGGDVRQPRGSWPPCRATTLVCCGHEYTESNARFALSVDPDNAALMARAGGGRDGCGGCGRPTVPSVMADEQAANPFLRAPDAATFADLRARKDRF